MQEVLPEGGMIRKLWIGETAKYRDHMLRLDPESRRSRFAGGVSDDFVRKYVDLSLALDAVVHGFFVDGVMRGAAELRPLGAHFPHQAEAAFSVEKPWQSHGVGSALLRRTLLGRAQSRLPASAYGVPRREPPHAAARAQIRRRTVVRFRKRGRRGRIVAADAVVADARNDVRRPRLRHRDARSARRGCCALDPVSLPSDESRSQF